MKISALSYWKIKKTQSDKNLDSTLDELKKRVPIDLYELLLKIRKTVDDHTTVRSLKLSGSNLMLAIKSKNALNNLERIKSEFGNIKVSNIRTLTDGTKDYTVWVEIEE